MKSINKNSLSISGKIKAFSSAVIPRLEAILGPLIEDGSPWKLAFHEAIGLYGYYMAYKQEEINEFVKFIKSHPEKFKKDIVESKEFRDGFVVFFKDYLELRVKEKKKIAQNIFVGFAQCSRKDGFELEKFDDTLLKISVASLTTLAFFKNEMLPMKEMVIRKGLKSKNISNSGQNEEWWFDLDWEREPLSSTIQQWLYDNFNPNSPKVEKEYSIKDNKWDKKLQSNVFDKEREKSKAIYDAIDELVQLGILKIRVTSGGGLGMGGGAEYDFSKFGYQFIEYIEL
jgi:hypothetical protein